MEKNMRVENYDYLGQEVDISTYFNEIGNAYFNIKELTDFDEDKMTGIIRFGRYERKARMSFNAYTAPFEESKSWTFPPSYSDYPEHPIKFSFVNENVVRIQTSYSNMPSFEKDSLMVEKQKEYTKILKEKIENGIVLSSSMLEVQIQFAPFCIEVRDKKGKILTKTLNMESGKSLLNSNPLPFSYVRRGTDMQKYAAASFSIQPGEHFYGAGESFTKLDKIGQKIQLWTKDAHGVETQDMYKPIPFYMSSRGYGIFAHTSAAVTFDFGHTYQEAQTIFLGEENVDLYIIVGKPKEILSCYTDLTGKSTIPPLWSYGLWMSRITYDSENQARAVAMKLKEHRIPCDVIHLDTGWFEEDWSCDYEFSSKRFNNPQKMIEDLKQDGYHISLWQLPYFTPKNKLYPEIIKRGLAIKDPDGKLPTDDAILDFSNPDTIKWYQQKLQVLLNMGVDAIKVDFGEAAPISGQYHSGKSGKLEHNLYPLRYNKAVGEITKEITGENLIWARSAWAGSQRYPLHWGGDCENTNMGMLASLRGGLSLGICGFSFWSHDVGGFVKESPEELYGRWMFMGIFTSHIRCHGLPPKEPWNYSKEFLELFRKQMEYRYRLLPYIYVESLKAVKRGHPLLKTMFFEFSEDNNCLEIENQYMFGDSMLVAPLFEDYATERMVYIPQGTWIDLQNTQNIYQGNCWYNIMAGELNGVVLVRQNSIIPMVESALTTKHINWKTLKYYQFTGDNVLEVEGMKNQEDLEVICDLTTFLES